MTSIEIRVLSPAEIADHHAHLLRLDPDARGLHLAGTADERGVDGHCLRLMAAGAILIGGFVDGTLRASLEIIPDGERQAQAILTCEPAFHRSALVRTLIARLFDEARGRRFKTVWLRGIEDMAEVESAARINGVAIESDAPLGLHFEFAPTARASALPTVLVERI